MLEQILSDIQKADSEWNVVILRYFNPIGAHKSGTMGENPNGIPNNLMPYVTQVAVGKLKELGVFGNDYDTYHFKRNKCLLCVENEGYAGRVNHRARQNHRIIALSDKILDARREYTDEDAFIYAYTDNGPHNTITPIARKRGE